MKFSISDIHFGGNKVWKLFIQALKELKKIIVWYKNVKEDNIVEKSNQWSRKQRQCRGSIKVKVIIWAD